MRFFLWCFLLLPAVGASPLSAQAIEDDGPYAVGWRDVNISDTHYGRGSVAGRIYYPATVAGQGAAADPLAGPFPLVSFMHGWTQPASDYDNYCSHLASWGFVVMSNNTETSIFFVSMQAQAKDTRALMQWVEDQSQNGSSWLRTMVDLGDWSTAGHSMGGGATSYLLREDARIRNVVMFEPYLGSLLGNTSVGYNAFDNFTGSVLVLGGSSDLTNNWLLRVRPWYNQADGAKRRMWGLIQGGDHFGSTDWAGTNGSLSGAEQHRMHRLFGTGFLRAEILGEENLYYELLGQGGQSNPITPEAAGVKPPLWLLMNPMQTSEIALGSFGDSGSQLRVGVALATGTTQTPWGVLGLDSASLQLVQNIAFGLDGIHEVTLAPPSSLSGATVWFQGLQTQGAVGEFSRVTSLILP